MPIIRGIAIEIIKGMIISAAIWIIKEAYKEYKKEKQNAVDISSI
jgi:hypothetical protein